MWNGFDPPSPYGNFHTFFFFEPFPKTYILYNLIPCAVLTHILIPVFPSIISKFCYRTAAHCSCNDGSEGAWCQPNTVFTEAETAIQ